MEMYAYHIWDNITHRGIVVNLVRLVKGWGLKDLGTNPRGLQY